MLSFLFSRPWGSCLCLGGLGLICLFCTQCAPTVNIATPQPMKVDLNMRLDIYQKEAPKTKGEELSIQVAANRRMRLDSINHLKTTHVLGENRDGYLEVKQPPTEAKAVDEAKTLVNAENADRSVLYLNNAQSQNKPLEIVQQDFSQVWRDRAKPGEWVQKEDGTWIQK